MCLLVVTIDSQYLVSLHAQLVICNIRILHLGSAELHACTQDYEKSFKFNKEIQKWETTKATQVHDIWLGLFEAPKCHET